MDDPLLLSEDEFTGIIWEAFKTACAKGNAGEECAGQNVFEELERRPLKGQMNRPEVRRRAGKALAQLVVRGFISPGSHALHHVTLGASFEVQKLKADDVRYGWPRNSELARQFPEADQLDETLAAYFLLAVRCFEAGSVDDAALFFIGAAAERALELAGRQMQHLVNRGKTPWKNLGAKERVDRLAEAFRDVADAQGKPEFLGEAELVECVGNTMRLGRNDAGHPRDKPPQLSRSMVAARICEFPDYVRRLIAAAKRTT